MQLDDIQKTATKMTRAELIAEIEKIRRGRVQTVKQVEKKVKKQKTTSKKKGAALAKQLGMSTEEVLKILYGDEKDKAQ